MDAFIRELTLLDAIVNRLFLIIGVWANLHVFYKTPVMNAANSLNEMTRFFSSLLP